MRNNLLFVLSDVFCTMGGIQRFNRLVFQAAYKYAEERHCVVCIISKNDLPKLQGKIKEEKCGNVLIRGCAGSKVKLVWEVLRASAILRPKVAFYGLLNFSPMALLTYMAGLTSDYIVHLHGIEAWRRLSPFQRSALSQAKILSGSSVFTLLQAANFNGLSLGGRVCLLQPVLPDEWFAMQSEQGYLQRHVKRPARLTLLTVSRLVAEEGYKGVDTVLYALHRLQSCDLDLCYVVVGDGSDRTRLEGLARRLGLLDKVEFTGWVSDKELHKQYAACDIFLMPSAGEGFGIVFLEAMSYEKPVVGGKAGGTPEIFKDGKEGFLVEPENIDEVANIIYYLATNPDLRKKMGEAGRAAVLNCFTFTKFCEKLFSALDWALNG